MTPVLIACHEFGRVVYNEQSSSCRVAANPSLPPNNSTDISARCTYPTPHSLVHPPLQLTLVIEMPCSVLVDKEPIGVVHEALPSVGALVDPSTRLTVGGEKWT